MKVEVHPRVMQRHPNLLEEDVLAAWKNPIACRARIDLDHEEYIALGSDRKGRLLEMIASRVSNDTWIIFHAMTPPTKKALIELRLSKR